jgi:CBS domain containing-hemolysin-like protein
MIEGLLIFGGLFLLAVIDLLTIGTRAGYTQVNQARLLGLRDHMETAVNRTLNYFPLPLRIKASISLILVVVRFCIAALLILSFFIYLPDLSLLGKAGLLLSAALILFGFEWGVERLVFRNPELWAVRLIFYVRLLLAPLSYIFVPFGVKGQTEFSSDAVSTVTEDDLKSLVDMGEEEGVFEQDERRMIYSIFQLADTLVREIMVPRIDMLTLDVNTPLLEAVDAFLKSGHSRVPVHEDTVDNTLGLLYAKDLLRVWREGNPQASLREMLRTAFFVPEAKKVDELLTEMQSQRFHMAVVVDEYGGIAGLVTLEDIVEEILGEIQDEYDQAEEAPYQVSQDGDYLFLGRIDLDDFNDIMDCQLPTDEADTLGGYIYSRLGHVPSIGEKVQKDNLLLTVEQVSARRIRKVRAAMLPLNEFEDKERNGDNG